MVLVIFEGLIACLFVLLSCVIGIANGAHNMAFFYEEDVQNRVEELGLISKKQIKENSKKFSMYGILPYFVMTILAVYVLNKARGFWDTFWQISTILLIEGIFDRLFIDYYWVNNTKAWEIPGTEDLKPYINKKAWIKKWTATIIGYPMLAAIISLALSVLIK